MKRVKFHKGTFKKYVRSRFPSFDPLPTFFHLVRFPSPPPPKVRSFWLEFPLSPSISILEKFRENKLIMSTIVSLVELNVSFLKPQWNLYKMDTIGAWQKYPLYGDIPFIENSSENQKSSKVNKKSTICHDFRSPDLLEGPKDGKM